MKIHPHKNRLIAGLLSILLALGPAVPALVVAPDVAEAALDSTQNEYTIDVGPIGGSTTANYVFASFFNPAGSGKYISISRIRLHNTAVAAANWTDVSVRRISVASGGTQISAANVPKKHVNSANATLEVRTTGPSVTFSGTTDSRVIGAVAPGAAGAGYSEREMYFGENDEQLVLAPGEGIAYYQTAAGNANHRMNILVTWKELTADPGSQNEYVIAYPRVERAVVAAEKYATFFNPSASGKVAIIKRIRLDVDADTTANYTMEPTVVRISAASGGTQISAANVPKKHSSTSNTAMELRYTNVTATLSNSTSSSMIRLVPPGAANQNVAHQEFYFSDNQEKLILQPGEGIAVYAKAAGDIDHLVRLSVEWDEESSGSTPSAQNEYIVATPVSFNVAWVSGDSLATFFNPAGSGKYAVIKRVGFRVAADAAATYIPVSIRPITAASGANLLAASDITKKNTSSSASAMEIRYASAAGGVTETFSGSANTRLMGAQTPGAVGQPYAMRLRAFENSENVIVAPGTGLALYVEGTSDINHRFIMNIEWQEVASNPSAQGEYMISAGPINGSTTSGYRYLDMFNPSGSGKYIIINRIEINTTAVGTAVYIPLTLRRISAASAGTLVTAADIPKKNSGSSTSVAEVRTTNPTVTYAAGTDSRLLSAQTPGAAGSATAQQMTAIQDREFFSTESVVLAPGEGIALYQESAGNANFRVRLAVDWKEQATAPTAEGDHIISIGPVTGSVSDGYVYESFMNPTGSGKTYIVRRLGIDIARTGLLVGTPANVIVRKITAASGGTAIGASDIPKKNASSSASGADIRYGGVSATFDGSADSAYLRSKEPVTVGDMDSIFDVVFRTRSEIILKPGEGVAIYQDFAGGTPTDILRQYRLELTWAEFDADQSVYRFFANADSTTPGATLAPASTPATLSSSGDAFRLRQVIGYNDAKISTATESYKLQYATKSGTCDTGFSGETYADVTTSTPIAYNDNASVADGAAATSHASDPTNGGRSLVLQTYEEANNFSNSSSTSVEAGQDALWDFSLKDNTAPGGTTYCLRVVRADDSLLDTYTYIPEITIAGGASSTLSFSLSHNAVGFGTLSKNTTRYATNDLAGSTTQTEAHTITASTNATSGYVITVQGNTLTSGAYTIDALGATNTTPTTNTEQFGIRATVSGSGNGSVSAPYAASGFAFDTASFPDQIASDPDGDDVSNTYSIRYVGNIAGTTEAGDYTATLTYVITAGF